MRIMVEACYNFNQKQLRGCEIEVLPFLRVFPPAYAGGWATNRGWTVHFGWLYWTVMFFQYYDGPALDIQWRGT